LCEFLTVFANYHRIITFIAVLGGFFVQTSAPSSIALLEGTVVNKVTSAPLKHAYVIYIKTGAGSELPSPISTDTDGDGHFAIQLEPGNYRLWVEKPGFARQVYGARTPEGSGEVLTLAPGQRMRDLAIRVVPLGAISGRVLDEDGEPLQGVGIQVLRFSYATGRRQLVPVGGAVSNDRGEYRVYALPAGRYFLLATPRGAPLTHPPDSNALIPEVQEPLAALYYPGVPDPASASQIFLPEGGELADVNFPLTRIRAVTLRGRVLSPVEDFAGSQLQVVLAHSDGKAASYINRVPAAVDRATGRFEFRGVAPGSYWLVASQLYGKYALGGRVSVEVSGPAPQENLTVALAPGFDIVGTVEMEGAPRSLPHLTVRLTPSEGLALGPQPVSAAGANGSLRLSGVTPGIWGLTIDSLPEGVWIKAATFGDADVIGGELKVAAGPPGPLRIVLAGNGAQVSGVVAEDSKARRATVVLVPTAPELQQATDMYRATSTQDKGAFAFTGVRPGAYKLFAFEEVEALAWLDPDFLKLVDSMGESISVMEGDRIVRQLAPITSEALLGGN
jgi:hypothetical protein